MKDEDVMFHAPPRLLMGVVFLFWGAMQEQALAGLLAAILFEARHWISLRWTFGEKGFARAWQLSILLLIVSVVGVFQIEDRDSFDFLQVLAWLPFIMMPIGLAQQYASDRGVPMTTFSFIARRKLAVDRREGRPVQIRPFQLGYPFFALVLICAGMATNNLRFYSVGVLLLMGVAFFKMPNRARRGKAWATAYLMAAVLAGGMVYGIMAIYDYIHARTSGYRVAQSQDLSFESRTRMGQITDLQQEMTIQWRFFEGEGERPDRLRLASYSLAEGSNWRAQVRSKDFLEEIPDGQGAGGDFEKLIPLGGGSYVYDRDDLDREVYAASGRIEGLLTTQTVIPMPLGTRRLGNVEAVSVGVNSMGTTQIDQPGHGAAGIEWSLVPGMATGDLDPSTRDLEVPQYEVKGLKTFLEELEWDESEAGERDEGRPVGLSEERTRELEYRLRGKFYSDFTYSTFLDYDYSRSPISEFLEDSEGRRSGHCEYFASATTMLMRQAGIPARYCVGYVVHEQGSEEGEWILRSKHAHAWCQVYVGGTWVQERAEGKGKKPEWRCRGGRWVEVDLTPPGWMEDREGGWLQGIFDGFQKVRTGLILWFARPVVSAVFGWAVAILGLALVGYLIVKLIVTRRADAAGAGDSWEAKVRARNLLLKFESWLSRRVGSRPAGIPMSTWLRAHLPSDELGLISAYEAVAFRDDGGDEGQVAELQILIARAKKGISRQQKTPKA